MFSFSVCNTSYFSSHRPDLAWLDYDYDTESLIEATRIPKIVSSEAINRPSDVHTFQNDGEVVVGTDASRHPLFDVLEHATSEWESLLDTHNGDVSAQTRVFRPMNPTHVHAENTCSPAVSVTSLWEEASRLSVLALRFSVAILTKFALSHSFYSFSC